MNNFKMPSQVFYSWYLNNECNYNCSYCQPLDYKTLLINYKKWIDIWQDIYKRYGSCHIHISGGEPFVYPEFFDLISELIKMHTLEFSTNLSWNPESFLKRITPDRARIGVSLHPEFAEFGEFLNKVILLKNAGFDVWVNYVGYPPILKDMAMYRAKFIELGIHFSVLPFNGYFSGRKYPEDYTEEEKKYLAIAEDSEEINKKTLDWRTDQAKSNTKGLLCRMGQMYARIYPDAEVYRCCGNGAKRLGNLLDATFALFDEPQPCECERCPCWRCMLVGKEEYWLKHWIIPKRKNE